MARGMFVAIIFGMTRGVCVPRTIGMARSVYIAIIMGIFSGVHYYGHDQRVKKASIMGKAGGSIWS